MALRKRGKKGFWHAYFRTVNARPDGSVAYSSTTVNLYTADLAEAKALEAELMRKNRAVRNHQRALAVHAKMDVAAGIRPPEDAPAVPVREKRRKRLRLADALDAARKYREIGKTNELLWNSFLKNCSARYMDEVTPEAAFAYLSSRFPDEQNAKSFNNTKSALHTVFRLTLIEAGIAESPFAKIPNRVLHSRHQRPFTEEEFLQIYDAAPEPWKSASLIAWFTGLRQKDVFTLEWTQIAGDVITTTPAKTARFGRSVQIPLHPQLAAALRNLPRNGARVLGSWPYEPDKFVFQHTFSRLLERLGIGETPQGIVTFNSFRDSFVTRCDEAGIPRHAIRGIVGHVSDDQTDLYSHDLTTARLIQNLPAVTFSKKDSK